MGKVKDFFELNPPQNTNRYVDYINYFDTSSVTQGVIENVEYLEKEFPSRANRCIELDDILYSSVRPNLKHYYHYKVEYDHAIASTGFIIIRNKNRDNYSSDFLFYYLSSDGIVQYLSNIAELSQSTFPSFSAKDLGKIDLPDFDYATQQKISSILSAYDTIIENNNKRIKLLERMAENLYKEWFVRFRFPGHESVEFKNGVPKEWEKTKLGNKIDIKRGGSPRPIQEYISEDGLKWLKISDATKSTSPYILTIEECIKQEGLSKTVYLEVGNLILSNSATPGLPKILDVDTCIHDGWLYFPNLRISKYYLYLFFLDIRKHLVSLGNGAVFTNLKTDILKNYSVIFPTEQILKIFDKIIEPFFKELLDLEHKNQILSKQRDLLLPRLMSGKLEV